MQKIFFPEKKLSIIKKNKKRLENALDIKVEIKNKKEIFIESKKDSIEEHIASEVFDALALGFDIDTALLIKNTNFVLKKINIKSYAKNSRIKVIKGRIIGTKGRTKHIIEKLAECNLVIADHVVAIIGRFESIEIANHAIGMLIRGSPQQKAYGYLERSR